MSYRNDINVKNTPTETNIHGEKINFLGDNKILAENRNLKNLSASELNDVPATTVKRKKKTTTLSKLLSSFVAIMGAALLGVVAIEPITSMFGGGLLSDDKISISFNLNDQSVNYEGAITGYEVKDDLTVLLYYGSETVAKHMIILQSPDQNPDQDYSEQEMTAEREGYELYFGEVSEDGTIYFYGYFYDIDLENTYDFNLYDGSRLIYKTQLSDSAIQRTEPVEPEEGGQ